MEGIFQDITHYKEAEAAAQQASQAKSNFLANMSHELILGAVGVLQFDVVAHRLKDEYGVDCQFEAVNVNTARRVSSDNSKKLEEFQNKLRSNLALDHAGDLAYIAPSRVNLTMTEERWPEIEFLATREHGDYETG